MYFIFDIETTGLPKNLGFNKYYHFSKNDKYDNARIVQISWQVLDQDYKLKIEQNFIIKRDAFDINNSKFHGITNQISDEQGIPLISVLDAIEQDMHNCEILVAHNILFDINILLNHCHRANKSTLISYLQNMQQFCTMEQSKSILKIRQKNFTGYKYPSLQELYYFYFKKEFENAHNSLYDVKACSECFILLNRNV